MSLSSYEMRFWGIGAAALAIALAALGCEAEPKPYPPPPQCTATDCSPSSIGGVGTHDAGMGSGGTGGTISNLCSPPKTECTSATGAGGAATSVCTDLQTDPNNCGACNVPCPSGDICTGGTCMP